MAGKRAQGGGRKPQGEFRGLTETLSIRITPALRKRLEQERRRSGRSMSQEAGQRLKASLDRSDQRLTEKPNQWATAQLVSRLLERLEMRTGERWQDDAFTFLAFKAAINLMLERLKRTPLDAVTVPPRLAESLEKWVDLGDDGARIIAGHSDPKNLGEVYFLGLMIEVEIAIYAPFEEFDGKRPWFYGNHGHELLADIRAKLGIEPVNWQPTQDEQGRLLWKKDSAKVRGKKGTGVKSQ
jgi:hypothetical protein